MSETDQASAEAFRDTGIFPNVPFEVYDEWPGLNKSSMWTLQQKTPAHYRWEQDHPEAFDKSCLRIGQAESVAMLEPERFEQEYIQTPSPPDGERWNRAKKTHKGAWAAFLAENPDKTILEPGEWELCLVMRDALWNNRAARMLLEKAVKEVSMQWRDPTTGMLLKGRMDLWIEQAGILADLKTARFAAPTPFGRAAYKFGYHFQMAMYYDGATQVSQREIAPPVLIVVEKQPPYCVACYQVEHMDLELGRAQYKWVLERIAECMEANHWPGYEDGVMSLALPSYAGTEIGA